MYNDYPQVYETTIVSYVDIIIYSAISIIIILLLFYSLSRVFKKCYRKPILAFIPFYNLYVLLEICDISRFHIVLLLIPIVNIFSWIKISSSLSNRFSKGKGFAALIFFFPIIAFFILGFSTAKYVGINNELIKGIYIEELKKKEDVVEEQVSVVKRDTSIRMGSNSVTAANSNGELKADMNVLNQPKKVEVKYKECPKCHNMIKEDVPVCFFCGEKFVK